MSRANYIFFTRPSDSFSKLRGAATDMSMLETKLEFGSCRGQIGGWKLFLNSLTLAKKN